MDALSEGRLAWLAWHLVALLLHQHHHPATTLHPSRTEVEENTSTEVKGFQFIKGFNQRNINDNVMYDAVVLCNYCLVNVCVCVLCCVWDCICS